MDWVICQACQGSGKKSIRLRKKVRLQYKKTLAEFEKSKGKEKPPVRPKINLQPCLSCHATGLVSSTKRPVSNANDYPHLAIIGGGIGGVALAVACLHRGIPFTLYERDISFNSRPQGYGLTLQQASKTIKELGVLSLAKGVYSTNHLVHNTNGKVISEWGIKNRELIYSKTPPKRTNIHIARQSLRLALLEQLGGYDAVQWGHQLVDFKDRENEGVELKFKVDNKIKIAKADVVIGADGIRSMVRKRLIGDEVSPLHYLGCMVLLGICPLANLNDLENPLLDLATVFQTVNGNERVYMMPYSSDTIMWQFSFPIPEEEAKALTSKGTKALKEEACRRMQWHTPVPQIIAATQEADITGYPVYDREPLKLEMLGKGKHITLIGDAAHPMSPFKGQGANQALLDALALARIIGEECKCKPEWRQADVLKNVLTSFELEMIERSASKVKDSAEAVELLHSHVVLREGNQMKGRDLKRKET